MTSVSWLLLQSGEAVELPERTAGQFWLGVALVALLCAAGLFVIYRTQYAGLPEQYARHRQRLEGQRLDQTPNTVRIRAGETASQYRDALLSAFDRDASTGDADDDPTVLDAFVVARGELSDALAPVSRRLPTPALRAFELAAGVAVFGAAAVSSGRIVTWLLHGGRDRNIDGSVVDASGLFIDAAVEVATAFPYVGDFLAFGFSLALIAGTLAYQYWYVSALGIALTGIALVYLDVLASDDTDMDVVLVDRRTIALGTAKWGVVVWLAGVVPVAVASAAGAPSAGALVGVLLAAVAGLVAGERGVDHVAGALYETAGIQHGLRHHALRPLRRVEAWVDSVLPESAPEDAERVGWEDPMAALEAVSLLRDELEYDPEEAALELDKQLRENSQEWPPVSTESDRDVWSRVQAGVDALLVITARVTSVVLALGTLLLAAYVAVAVALEGSLWTIAGATLRAPVERQLLVAALVGTPLVVLAVQARAAWPSLQAAVADIWARQRVRTALLRRGMPTVVVLAVYPIASLFTSGMAFPWGALAAGIAAGLVGVLTRGIISALYRARYRVDLTPGDDDERPRTAVCHVYSLSDADGNPFPTITVNGTRTLGGRSRDTVVDDTIQVADAVTSGRELPVTRSEKAAEYAFEYGIVDQQDVDEKLRERVRKRALSTLRDAGGVLDRDEFDTALSDLPDPVVRSRVTELRRQGILRKDANFVYLERDPWASHSRSGRGVLHRLANRVT